MFNLFGQNGGNGRCFQSVSYSFSSSNGNVNHFYQTTTQAPGQEPVTNTYTTSGNMAPQVDNFFGAQNSLFGSSLFNNFFSAQNFASQPQQPQINGVEDNQMNEYEGPEIEDISDYLEGESFSSSPSKVEEVEDDNITEEELRKIQEMEYQESLLRDRMKTKRYEREDDDDFERVQEVDTCDIDVINSNATSHYSNISNNNITDIDDNIIGNGGDDENNELRELIRESYLSLSYPDHLINPIDSCTILVQLPNGKRVERTFNVQDTTWANVKTWVSFEMAKDKEIPTEEFPLESEFEICINYPFIILTSDVNIEKKLCEFKREIGRKVLIYIRKND